MRHILLGLAALLFQGASLAATPVTELLAAVPAPPASAREGARWLGEGEAIVQPTWKAVANTIATESQTAQRLQAEAGEAMTGSGLDMDRLQRDPAYQREVEARLSRMSLAEQQAFALQQQQAMQTAMLANMQQVSSETAAVMAAVASAQEYLQLRMIGPETAARGQLEAEESALAARYDALQTRLDAAFESGGEGCDAACIRRIEAKERAIWQQKLALADEEAKAWRSLFERERQRRGQLLNQAQAALEAGQYGRAAKAPSHRASLAMLHDSALADVRDLLELSGRIAQRIGGIARAAERDLAQ